MSACARANDGKLLFVDREIEIRLGDHDAIKEDVEDDANEDWAPSAKAGKHCA